MLTTNPLARVRFTRLLGCTNDSQPPTDPILIGSVPRSEGSLEAGLLGTNEPDLDCYGKYRDDQEGRYRSEQHPHTNKHTDQPYVDGISAPAIRPIENQRGGLFKRLDGRAGPTEQTGRPENQREREDQDQESNVPKRKPEDLRTWEKKVKADHEDERAQQVDRGKNATLATDFVAHCVLTLQPNY
jgi:hypothetical protein